MASAIRLSILERDYNRPIATCSRDFMKNLLAPLALLAAGLAHAAPPAPAPASPSSPSLPATAADMNAMIGRFAPVDLRADTDKLSKGDHVAIAKLIEAAKIVDILQLRQRWSGNEALAAALQKDATPLGQARRDYFWLNKGPWSIIDGNRAFMPAEYAGIHIPAEKPAGANFYPEGASKAALAAWMNGLPAAEKEQAQWFFTTIRTGKDGKFKAVKYADEYRPELERLSKLLKEAPRSGNS
jgi:hypothetical protein